VLNIQITGSFDCESYLSLQPLLTPVATMETAGEVNGIRHSGSLGYQRGSDYLVLMLLVPFICLARFLCERFGAYMYLSSDAAANIGRKKGKLMTMTKKFEESFWKSFYYSLSALFGVLFISWEPALSEPFAVYPNPVSGKFYWFYMFQIAFYMWMSVSLAWDVRRKDFYQMAAHHVVTLTLLVGSYSVSLTYAGALILMFHDIADPFLEIAKMCTYTKKETGGTVFFISFMVLFMFMRLIMYPYFAVYPCMFQTWPLAVALGFHAQVVWLVLNICLVVLLGLNCFWSYLIVKVCVTKIAGKALKDNRSDVESD
jgi:hypothetical protein